MQRFLFDSGLKYLVKESDPTYSSLANSSVYNFAVVTLNKELCEGNIKFSKVSATEAKTNYKPTMLFYAGDLAGSPVFSSPAVLESENKPVRSPLSTTASGRQPQSCSVRLMRRSQDCVAEGFVPTVLVCPLLSQPTIPERLQRWGRLAAALLEWTCAHAQRPVANNKAPPSISSRPLWSLCL
ncbi:hypothetical protein RRG08_054874 [Elysia crispata]|uniref:Uncharacterized protein n=1 Tax=Elysia crispata TaxID=231223 RepID=A0AAE1A5G0_9GAST|nr:hypothetical protein RRG08_054874 [Elysia crispata]